MRRPQRPSSSVSRALRASAALGLLLLASATDDAPSPAAHRLGAVGRVTLLRGDLRLVAGPRHELRGTLVVSGGATLTLDRGARLGAARGARLVVSRDGRLVAEGTTLEPVELTCLNAAASGGCWEGLTIHGNALVSGGAGASPAVVGRAAAGCPELSAASGAFGGCADDDSSGALRLVRVRWAGPDDGAAVELLGVGSRTVIEHLTVLASAHDGVRVRGGTVRMRWLRVMNAAASALTWADGWRGLLQFAALQAGAGLAPAIDGANAASAHDAVPRSAPVIHNVTVVGPPAPAAASLAAGAVRLHAGTAGALRGLLVVGRPALRRAALDVDDDATWAQLFAGALVVERSMFVGYAPVGDQDDDPVIDTLHHSPDVEGQVLRAPFRANTVLLTFGNADSTLRAAWAPLADLRPREGRPVFTTTCDVPATHPYLVATTYCGALDRLAHPGIPWTEPAPIFDASPAPASALGLLTILVVSPERGPLGGVRVQGDVLAGTDDAGIARTYAPAGSTPLTFGNVPQECEGPGLVVVSVPVRDARTITIAVTCPS